MLSDKQRHFLRNHFRKLSAKKIARKVDADSKEVAAFIATMMPPIEPRKKRLFTILSILLPVIFLALLEAGLKVFQYGGNLNLFISAEKDVIGYYKCNRNVARRYFYLQRKLPTPPKDLFLKKKPDNGYRIFVLGESTAAGFPYGNNIMFSRILEHRLSSTFPQKRIELINVAMSAICSYTQLDFMDEILDQQPDAILIHAGHNEFYGALGVASMESLGKIRGMVRLYLKLNHCRTFLMVRDAVGFLKKTLFKSLHYNTHDPTATLMERIVADRNIPMHSSLYSLGRRQFEENLKDILEKCRRAHVPVIVSEQVSNVRGQAPFISDKSGQDPSSEELFKTARSLESERQYGQARETYTQAKDMDQLRFRASEDFNELIHSLADEYKAPVVPMKQYFENAAPHGLVGNTLMVDHLHPNIEGYFLMADAFYQTMKLNHLIQNEWPEWSLSNSQLMRDWGITELDTLYADLSIRYLKGGWPFKPRTIPNTSLDNYHPKDKVQELALKALVDKDFGIELAHVHLADHYEKKGELDLALKEYRALMDMVPDEGEFYEKAAKINIHQKKFPEAYGLLRRAQVVRESDFTTKWIGQLLLAQNKLVEARPYLEKALSRAPGDPQLLFNLARLYILTMQFDKADPLIGNLQKFKDPKVTELQALEKKMIPVARQLKEAAILLK